MKFQIKGLPKILSNGSQGSWRAKHYEKKRWKKLVMEQAFLSRQVPAVPYQKARVKLVRHSSVCPDFDGLASSFKAVLDGLVAAGVLIDDNMQVVIPEYKWEKAKPKQGFIEIEVLPLDDLHCMV